MDHPAMLANQAATGNLDLKDLPAPLVHQEPTATLVLLVHPALLEP
jgi:hypothetical protein